MIGLEVERGEGGQEGKAGDVSLRSMKFFPSFSPLSLSLPSFTSFPFATCALFLLNQPVEHSPNDDKWTDYIRKLLFRTQTASLSLAMETKCINFFFLLCSIETT